MTEDEARGWIETRFGRAGYDRMERLATAIVIESERQNLISRRSIVDIWSRHIVDSAQLLDYAPVGWSTWLDVGTGAGFPGLVIGLLSGGAVTLVEPRRKRADFLQAIVDDEKMSDRILVATVRVQTLPKRPYSIISARAVAAVDEIFVMTAPIADSSTTYLLLRGVGVTVELESVETQWHGMFHVEPSVTSSESGILVARGVRQL